ncbi:MAG: hypothetical protein LC737_07000, partial [Chloroflexi bacterium]|nr:hypothetical protein [Chloroflexota bacterium]
VIPVYAPMSGYFSNVGTMYGFLGSSLLSGELDRMWEGRVPTRKVRLWFTHMASGNGAVSYVTRPTGPISEGDLIGYQGTSQTYPVHVHVGIYNGDVPIDPTSYRTGVLDPKPYFNADVTRTDPSSYPIGCNSPLRGGFDVPFYNGVYSQPILFAGWTLDLTATSGTGVDQVWLYVDGYIGTGTWLGAIPYGQPRPDISAYYCQNQPPDCSARFQNSGYSFWWNPSPSLSIGRHSVALYAHQLSTNAWVLVDWRYFYAPFTIFNFLPLFRR